MPQERKSRDYVITPWSNKLDALMYWECLRRNKEYREFYGQWEAAEKKFKASSIAGKNWTECPKHPCFRELARLRYLGIFKWKMGPISPDIPFAKLRHEDTYLMGGFKRITLPAKELGEDVYHKLAELAGKQGYLLPVHFQVEITHPEVTAVNSTGKKIKLRKRVDLGMFKAEMLAWDMRSSGKTWHEIGKKITPLETDTYTLIRTARNYHDAAQIKIDRHTDWRVAI